MPTLFARPDTVVLTAAAGLLAVSLACGLIVPPLFWLFLMGSVVAATGFLAFCFPTGFCVAWLLVTGMSLEMAFADLVGGEIFQPVIAAVKGTEIGLAFVCMVRFGPKLDPLCPAWAFLAMTVTGMAHGLYPGMTTMDSVRSLIGSMTPFVFCFCKVPRSWADAIVRTAMWCPVVAVTAGVPLAVAGIRPLFVDSGGARLGGLGHPAFLAGICLTAIYACLIQLFREGRRRDLPLLIVNFLILVLTGARAPAAFAVAVTGISLVSIRSSAFAARDRALLVLAGLAMAPALLLLVGNLDQIRLFHVALNETSNLSGRDLLWPNFEDAAAQSRWFGWGIGAGNAVIPRQGQVAQLLHTWAAHNEYLRIQVEGGVIGETLLIALFAGWAFVHTRELWPSDRRIMRLVLLAFAGHAFTDNLLISTPACVMFAFVTAVFARPGAE
jgi:O-antigen ligase